MPRYSEERKAAILKKLLPPHNRSVASVATEEGISNATLYSWLKQCREKGVPVPGYTQGDYEWSPDAKLAVVIETATMSETELGAYCREKGLYPEQIQQWKAACLEGAGRKKSRQKQRRNSAKKTERPSSSSKRKYGAKTRCWQKQRRCWCFQKSSKPCTARIRTAARTTNASQGTCKAHRAI